MMKRTHGFDFVHVFAVPHHFKGQRDGAGRDERDNLTQCVAN